MCGFFETPIECSLFVFLMLRWGNQNSCYTKAIKIKPVDFRAANLPFVLRMVAHNLGKMAREV
jgi:hypothetical protein